MPKYYDTGDRPWIIVGTENNLLQSSARLPYQFGWAIDTKILYIYDISSSSGKWEKITSGDSDGEIGQIEIYKDGNLVGTRGKLNYITGSNQSLSVTDDSTNERVDIKIDIPDASSNVKGVIRLSNHLGGNADNPTITDDVSNQRVRASVNNNLIGIRREINFTSGSNVNISGSDDDTNNRVNITISSSFSDERVKLSSSDPTSGYLSDKIDNNTIIADSTNNYIKVANNTSIQKVNVYKDNGLVGTRSTLNFLTGTNQTLTISDDATNDRVDIKIDIPDASSSTRGVLRLSNHLGGDADNPTVLDDTSNQRVRVSNNGTLVGTRREINFIPGNNITISSTDDNTNNRVDVTIGANINILDEKVKADSTDTTSGFLSEKVDDQTIKVNTTNHKLYVPDDSSNQRVRVSVNATNIGTKRQINFISGNGISISGVNNEADNRIDLTIATDPSVITDEKVKSDSGDPSPGYLEQKVDNSTIKVNTTAHQIYVANNSSVQKVRVSRDGTLSGTRQEINFIPGNNISITASDDNTNDRVNVTIAAQIPDPVDEKVKASSSDTTAGYLDQKVDNSTIKVNTSTQKMYVEDNTSTQKVKVQNDGTLVGTRWAINFRPGSNITIDTSDDPTYDRVNVLIHAVVQDEKVKARSTDPTSGYLEDKVDNNTILVDTGTHKMYIPHDKTTQRVTVSSNGTVAGTRKEIHFISGNNITITASDDNANNRVNVTIASNVSVVDEKVKSRADDTTAGYLSDKIDNNTIVLSGALKLKVQDNTNIQKVHIYDKNLYTIGIRSNLRFYELNSGTELSLVDNSSSDRIDIGIGARATGSIEVSSPSGLRLIGDNNAQAKQMYSTGVSSASERVWRDIPLVVQSGNATLNETLNLTTTDQILDPSTNFPAFQLVLQPGRHMIVLHTEAHIRGSCGSSSGSEQVLLSLWKREGTTDTLLRNIRAVFSSLNPNTTQTSTLFGGFDAITLLDTTYSGTSTDTRGNQVTGTVIFVKGRYTQSGGVTVNLAQVFSTTYMESSKIL